MRLFGIVLCLVALGLTGYSAVVYKAPSIEADLERRASLALSALGADEVDVRMDGRHATLEGQSADDSLPQRAFEAIAAVPGIAGTVNAITTTPPSVSPYRLSAVKDRAGIVTVDGLAPSGAVKILIEADARAIFGDSLAIEIDVADGAPEGDWRAVAGSAFDALATLRHGRMSIEDTEITIEGEVSSEADVNAIDLFAQSTPDGFTWAQAVDVQIQEARPYVFSVTKAPGVGVQMTGFAPDEATRDVLIEEGKAVAGDLPLIADIQIAEGMPDEEWPSLVRSGIGAMRELDAGRFDVVDSEVTFSNDPGARNSEAGDGAATVAEADPVETVADEQPSAITGSEAGQGDDVGDAATAPAPDGAAVPVQAKTLTVDKVSEGTWSVRGVVPDENAETSIVQAITERAGAEPIETEFERAGDAADEDWLAFATDHLISLDEVSAGRLQIDDFSAHFIGVVETVEEIEPVRATLQAIDQAMTVDLQPVDPRPVASLDISLSPEDGVAVAGALPGGLSEEDALSALGLEGHGGTLSDSGRGGGDGWLEDLSRMGTFLPIFERAEFSLDESGPRIEGVLYAHANADDVTREMESAFGEERRPTIDLGVTSTAHEEGATRSNPLTGEDEVYRQGFWLPVVDIAADEQACNERSASILASRTITFGRAQPDLDSRAAPALSRLAAIALACLDEDAGLALEIGGHTDSRGSRELNEELSLARADAVMLALAARGVPAERMTAVGYGDAEPIADNATYDGRAANRRITFEWRAAKAAAALETKAGPSENQGE